MSLEAQRHRDACQLLTTTNWVVILGEDAEMGSLCVNVVR